MNSGPAGPAEIADLVRRETGIVLPAARETAVRAAMERAAPGLDSASFARAVSDPAGGRGLVDRLIDEVTNQETSFVRDRRQLDEIAWHSLLQSARAAGSGTIRVWSAGCATGEEAYTLSLLAAEAFAPPRAPPPVDVLGTDISGAALAAAAAGRYRERAVRALEPSLRGRYLARQDDGTYLVDERLRGLVRFRRHNLARAQVPLAGEAGFDLITCRNVLIYFAAPLAERVIDSLEQSLRPGGILLLGAADALQRRVSRPPGRRVSRPPGRRVSRQPAPAREQRLAAALAAADQGDHVAAVAQVASLLEGNPLDADAQFADGLLALEAGRPAKAAAAFRRALCTDAVFALAAFSLGRAYDALADAPAARRSYEQALRMLGPADDRHERILRQLNIGDIAAACRARLDRRAVT